eukprot:scaffold1449_cov244-Pinguiococcus_pyrenoidosus.AAC.3
MMTTTCDWERRLDEEPKKSPQNHTRFFNLIFRVPLRLHELRMSYRWLQSRFPRSAVPAAASLHRQSEG